jgi:phosphatidylserine/phosphatidylglycerophosphate/cardiolipin synthase-like enzyme
MILPLLFALSACAPDPADVDGTRGGKLDVYFNDPGTRRANLWEPDAVNVMIETVRNAEVSIDIAVMGFTRAKLVDAIVAAHDRGVTVRMVGDASHLTNYGYQRFFDRHIPLVTGNMPHIMHDKYMIVDGRMVFGGTANWTDSDLRLNSNNFFLIDSPAVADDFEADFLQMFSGRFGNQKAEVQNNRSYQIGDTEVEVWFAPKEDAMGRILELVDGAQESVRFSIFAFTKDTLGSSLVRKQAEFDAKDLADGIPLDTDFRSRRSVAGVIDQSQLHSNGQYHEVYRLLGGGVKIRMDGNDNSELPGDYQAGGGRLHSKTMVIDGDGADPIVVTGSFNWSASATQSNDEYMLVFHGGRVAQEFVKYFDYLWDSGRRLGYEYVDENDLKAGDVLINEIMWYGLNQQDVDGNDEFIELRNNTDRFLKLDLWQIRTPDDFVVGFPPGTTLAPRSVYSILDHTLEPYSDGEPQDDPSAFSNGDMVVNAYNDNRQSRLYIKDLALEMKLLDPDGHEMDHAGNGGPAFFGGPASDGSGVARSMERRETGGDGALPESWYACSLAEGGENVNEDFRTRVVATPGQQNSPEPE